MPKRFWRRSPLIGRLPDLTPLKPHRIHQSRKPFEVPGILRVKHYDLGKGVEAPELEGKTWLLGMVRPERFELPTFWFVARRSIQLS